MDGLRVSELARRSGLPATTVRFYDDEGLLAARRSPSGYRLFDDGAVDRLAFVRTAKGLGLALPEIRGLLERWEHGQCSEVQLGLMLLVERRIVETRERIAELTAFGERLGRARAQLVAIERDGPCDPSCAFLGGSGRVAGPVPPAPSGAVEEAVEVAVACSLDGPAREERIASWRDVLSAVTAREAIEGGVRLTFDRGAVRLGELAELAGAEARCCPFLAMTLHVGPPTLLDVTAPDDALALVHELFGEPA